jgi:hypothetical protein
LANFGKEGAPQAVVAKIDQETLAEMIGTTRSTTSLCSTESGIEDCKPGDLADEANGESSKADWTWTLPFV